jgi:hypothetical protein
MQACNPIRQQKHLAMEAQGCKTGKALRKKLKKLRREWKCEKGLLQKGTDTPEQKA